eukprot:191916-Prorocentrum_minimum.AAC.1
MFCARSHPRVPSARSVSTIHAVRFVGPPINLGVRRKARGTYVSRAKWMRPVRSSVYSNEGPIGRRKRGYILTRDQSGAGSVGIFSRWTK